MPGLVSCPSCKVKLKLKPEYAGKRIKCPRCKTVLRIPSAQGVVASRAPAARTLPAKGVPAKGVPTRGAPTKLVSAKGPPAKAPPLPPIPKTKPKKRDDDEEAAIATAPGKPKKKGKRDQSPCPECGEMVDNTATKCPYCRTALEVDEEEQWQKWKPCPSCGQKKGERVLWTLWGSFYFSAMFHHVRCAECGTKYNGKTGRSNIVPAIICVTVPLLAIAGIGIAVYFYMRSIGYFQ